MFLQLLRAKLHMACVTQTRLDYHGSISIDEALIEAAGLRPFEAVTIANCSTGQRGETYVIRAPRGSAAIELNGAMARLATPGDRLIVLAFAYLTPDEVPTHQPRIIVLDQHNRIIEAWQGER
jgi:aspartate 1-decarboxylase